jgi:MFS family permease
MTSPVRRTSQADQAWTDLASQLTPAASLARIDAVTARAVTTITVIGLLLTGLGALAAGQFARHGAARGLAVAAVIAATLAVACALTAQVLTITRQLNTDDLVKVRAWYHRQFNVRALTTQAATILLILAALLAGATAATTLVTTPHPAKTIARTHSR